MRSHESRSLALRTDPATEIICFGYRAGGVDHSWAPTSHSRDPLEDLAANPDVAFVCFGGFEQVVWQKIMVDRHGFPPIPTQRWVDLRATASSFALPRSLDKALAALAVFCDFETRNVGGCDLTKVGVWRYATDPATEIICFGYRAGGVDHSWTPTSHSRDPLEELAANPDVAFVCFGGLDRKSVV